MLEYKQRADLSSARIVLGVLIIIPTIFVAVFAGENFVQAFGRTIIILIACGIVWIIDPLLKQSVFETGMEKSVGIKSQLMAGMGLLWKRMKEFCSKKPTFIHIFNRHLMKVLVDDELGDVVYVPAVKIGERLYFQIDPINPPKMDTIEAIGFCFVGNDFKDERYSLLGPFRGQPIIHPDWSSSIEREIAVREEEEATIRAKAQEMAQKMAQDMAQDMKEKMRKEIEAEKKEMEKQRGGRRR